MPLDFPNTPVPGQLWAASNNATYMYDGSKWVLQAGFPLISPTPPPSPVNGTMWWDSGNTGQLYVYFNDGNSSQFVVANSALGGPFLSTFGGTVSGPLTVSGAATLSGGGTLTGTFAGSPIWSAAQTYQARQFFQGSLSTGQSTTGGSDVSINGIATSARNLNFQAAGTARWAISGTNSSVTGTNADTDLTIGAYSDTGAFNTFFMKLARFSGPLKLGPPYAYDAGPIYLTHAAAVSPGGAVGNRATISDVQPTYTLATDPISTVSGSPVVTIALANTNNVVGTSPPSWVNLQGVTVTGGITPTGWLQVQSATPTSFTVNWTSNATATTTGGGSAVTVQPAFSTYMEQNIYTAKSSAQGFNLMHGNIYNVDPSFHVGFNDKSFGNVGWTMYWNVAASPNEPTGTYQTSILGEEMDILWRGNDDGYQPLIAQGVRSLGRLYVPFWAVPSYITGGGAANNVNTMLTIAGNNGFPGVYVGLSIQPSALVGKGIDTVSNHGGVGFDLFGSYAALGNAPFGTTNGTSTITVHVVPTATGPGMLRKQVNGGTIYIPNTYTVAGVTFGGGTYTIGAVNDAAGTFTIAGTGTASSTTTGGGNAAVIYFANLSPYAAMQLSGLWEDGIRSAVQSRFTSGLIVHTQPGTGFGWDDGTGIASVNASVASAGNIHVQLKPAGTGSVMFGTLPANAANDAAAASAGVPVGGVYRNGSVLMVRVA